MSFIQSKLNQADPNESTLFLEGMKAEISFLGGRHFFHKDNPDKKFAFKEITTIFIERCKKGTFKPTKSLTSQLQRLNQKGNDLLTRKSGIRGHLLRFFHLISQFLGNGFKKINHSFNIRLIESFISETSSVPASGVHSSSQVRAPAIKTENITPSPVLTQVGRGIEARKSGQESVPPSGETVSIPALSPIPGKPVATSLPVSRTVDSSVDDVRRLAQLNENVPLPEVKPVESSVVKAPAAVLEVVEASKTPPSSTPSAVISPSKETEEEPSIVRDREYKKQQARLLAIKTSAKNGILSEADLTFLVNNCDHWISFKEWTFPIALEGKRYNTVEFVELFLKRRKSKDPVDLLLPRDYFGCDYLTFRVDTEEARQDFNQLMKRMKERGRVERLDYCLRIEDPPILDAFEDEEIIEAIYTSYKESFNWINSHEADKNLIVANFAKLSDPRVLKNLPFLLKSHHIRAVGEYQTCLADLLAQNFHYICDEKGNLLEDWKKVIEGLRNYNRSGCQYFAGDVEINTLQFNLCESLLQKGNLTHFLTVFKMMRSTKRFSEGAFTMDPIVYLWDEITRLGKDKPEFMYEIYKHALQCDKDNQNPDLSHSFSLFETDEKFTTVVRRLFEETEKEKRRNLLMVLLDQPGLSRNRIDILLKLYTSDRAVWEETRKYIESESTKTEFFSGFPVNLFVRKFKRIRAKVNSYSLLWHASNPKNKSKELGYLRRIFTDEKNTLKTDSADLKAAASMCNEEETVTILKLLVNYFEQSRKLGSENSALKAFIVTFVEASLSKDCYRLNEKRQSLLKYFMTHAQELFVETLEQLPPEFQMFTLLSIIERLPESSDLLMKFVTRGISTAGRFLSSGVNQSTLILRNAQNVLQNNPVHMLVIPNEILRLLFKNNREDRQLIQRLLVSLQFEAKSCQTKLPEVTTEIQNAFNKLHIPIALAGIVAQYNFSLSKEEAKAVEESVTKALTSMLERKRLPDDEADLECLMQVKTSFDTFKSNNTKQE